MLHIFRDLLILTPVPSLPSPCSACDQLCSLSHSSSDATTDKVTPSDVSDDATMTTECFCGEGYSYNTTIGSCEVLGDNVFVCHSSARVVDKGRYPF